MPEASTPSDQHGLIVSLPEVPGGRWAWWRVTDGALEATRAFDPDDDVPWGDPAEDARVVALVPASDAPVRVTPRDPAMPLAQALSAARLGAGAVTGEALAQHAHVAVAATADGLGLLVAKAAPARMDEWLAELAAAGLEPAALVPAALALPAPASGLVSGQIAGQRLARTPDAAFAGEDTLIAALGGGGAQEPDDEALSAALLAAWRAPELNLRQGQYAPRRVSFFRLPDWLQLARMTAIAALLGFLILAVETIKLNADAAAREEAALAAAQARFPAAVDLATAQSLTSAELARRGLGGGSFSAPAAAVFAAMRPIPSLGLRDLGYAGDGTLRFQASAPNADDINRLLLALQAEGWQVTVPPDLAPDPTGATVAAITVRAP